MSNRILVLLYMLLLSSYGITTVSCLISGKSNPSRQFRMNKGFKTPKEGKIVAGYDCSIRDVPFYVELKATNNSRFPHVCGSSLLTQWWIITAAHCKIVDVEDFVAVAGITFSDFIDPYTAQVSRLEEFVDHPDYNEEYQNRRYDIAVAKLKTPMVQTRWVQFVKALERTPLVYEEKCRKNSLTAGFGMQWHKLMLVNADDKDIQTDFLPAFHNVHLQCIRMEIIPEGDCDYYEGEEICAYHEFKGVCSGDSGGPLVCGDTLIGITVRTPGCGARWKAASFTRIRSFLDFVDTWVGFGSPPKDGKRQTPTGNQTSKATLINSRRPESTRVSRQESTNFNSVASMEQTERVSSNSTLVTIPSTALIIIVLAILDIY